MRVFLSNLGCKLNQAEVQRLAMEFCAAGHRVVGDLGDADLHVVNSCTVTHVAARDSRKIARRAHRLDSGIKTVLTGCFVNSSPEEAAALAGVDLVVPNERKHLLVAEVERAFPEARVSETTSASPGTPYMPLEDLNTRSLLKIEDGCNMPCAFCVIPTTRGKQRSRPLDEVVDEARILVAAGFQEIVLTGVQISSYRWQDRRLYDLVMALLARTAVPRLRLTSIAPWQFDRRLLPVFDSGRVCRHVHLSLQSGCDETLQRMRRPYSASDFAELVESIRDCVPGVAITTDVIVGFPGETDDEFDTSLEFTEDLRFARVHAFPYSRRPHTEAAMMESQVPHQTVGKRMRRMIAVAGTSERRFWSEQLGHEVEILWEHQRDGLHFGTSDNYIRVSSREPQHLNQIVRRRLIGIGGRGMEVETGLFSGPLKLPSGVPVLDRPGPQESSYRAQD